MTVDICAAPTQVIESTSNGVFGEFLQGIGLDNQPFLITSPVNLYSKASFVFDHTLQGIKVLSSNKSKSQALADKVYERHQLEKGGVISIQTNFPVGKGLGSSSADLVATAKALDKAYSFNWNSEDIENIIRGIEPTDGVMYPGIVSYYYKQVRLKKSLGKIENIMILGVDEGGEIDTLEYNQIKRTYSKQIKQEYEHLHAAAEKAVKENNVDLLGEVSSRSSQLNQRFNPKEHLDEFARITEKLDLPGVIVAHSGTYIGFVLDTRSISFPKQLKELKQILFDSGHKYETFYIC